MVPRRQKLISPLCICHKPCFPKSKSSLSSHYKVIPHYQLNVLHLYLHLALGNITFIVSVGKWVIARSSVCWQCLVHLYYIYESRFTAQCVFAHTYIYIYMQFLYENEQFNPGFTWTGCFIRRFFSKWILLYSTCTYIVLHSTLQRLCLYYEAITLQYKTGATCGLLNRNGH